MTIPIQHYLTAITERLYLAGWVPDRQAELVVALNQRAVTVLLDLTGQFQELANVNPTTTPLRGTIIEVDVVSSQTDGRVPDQVVIDLAQRLVQAINQDDTVAILYNNCGTAEHYLINGDHPNEPVAWLLAAATVALQCNLRGSQVFGLITPRYREFNQSQLERLLQPVDFYSTRGPYGAFSNFSKHQVSSSDLGYVFPNGEALFQAYKSERAQEREEFIFCQDPRTAKDKGNRIKLRPDWEQVKYKCMTVVLQDKVNTNPELKTLLLSTGIRPIYEYTERDRIWGDGGDLSGRSGNNWLGRAWSELRNKLRADLTEIKTTVEVNNDN